MVRPLTAVAANRLRAQASQVARLHVDPDAPSPGHYEVARLTVEGGEGVDPRAAHWTALPCLEWGPVPYRTAFRAAWTDEAFWFRFDCHDDRPWHTMTRRDDCLWEEEVVEVFLDPEGAGRDYAEIEISPANVVCDVRVRTPWPSLVSDLTWNAEGLDTRVAPWPDGGAGGWTALGRLPWQALLALSSGAAAQLPPRRGDRWAFNVFRIKRPGGPAAPEDGAIYAAWSVPDAPSFHVPAAFQPLVFAGPHDTPGAVV